MSHFHVYSLRRAAASRASAFHHLYPRVGSEVGWPTLGLLHDQAKILSLPFILILTGLLLLLVVWWCFLPSLSLISAVYQCGCYLFPFTRDSLVLAAAPHEPPTPFYSSVFPYRRASSAALVLQVSQPSSSLPVSNSEPESFLCSYYFLTPMKLRFPVASVCRDRDSWSLLYYLSRLLHGKIKMLKQIDTPGTIQGRANANHKIEPRVLPTSGTAKPDEKDQPSYETEMQ